MSETQAIGLSATGARPGTRAAIARAAERTGVDFQYLLAQAKLESSLDPDAKAPTSSAAGLYQFTKGTWLETLDRHGDTHGLGWAADAISGKHVSDPAMASRIMALRYDPDASALMAAELARDNSAGLSSVLGRQPDKTELYLGHFMGEAGAGKFLRTLASSPDMSAASLMPQAAAANRTIFYERSGAPRSVSAVMQLMRGKVSAAMENEGSAWAVSDAANAGTLALPVTPANRFAQAASVRGFAAAQQDFAAPASLSMADTLHRTFGATTQDGQSRASTTVNAAYDQMRRLGL